jgi:hypothetical protein
LVAGVDAADPVAAFRRYLRYQIDENSTASRWCEDIAQFSATYVTE